MQFQRRALPGAFSIERLFECVRAALPGEIEVRLETNRFYSRGVLPRLFDALRARRRAGSVNHVLGDVHYLTWFLPRRGSILTVHDCISLERLRGPRRALLWLLWYWLPVRRAEQVTVVSEYTRQALARWVPAARARISVIPPPLAPAFTPWPAPPRGSHLRLLHVGTTKNKNLLRVIDACRGLAVMLVVVGELDPTSAARMRALGLQHENHVKLDDAALVELYRTSHALIFASTYEGFGLPIIEAQAIGRPVITSRICSMPEASGGAALLVDPHDVADIRRAIRCLLDDPNGAADLVQQGHANAARYAPGPIAAAYAELYRRAYAGFASADEMQAAVASRLPSGGAGGGSAGAGATGAGVA